MSMDKFFTREKGSAGKRIPLALPDGEETEDWIEIRSIDSKEYQEAIANYERRLIQTKLLDSKESKAAGESGLDDTLERELVLELNASLVKAWSFEEELSPENVKHLLVQAPQIHQQIEALARNRAFFYKSSPTSSSTTPKSKSKTAKS